MTTPANLSYTDVQTRVANALRLPTSNTAEMAKVAAVINEAYRDLCARRDWWWLRKRTVINTVPVFDTGTVSVTQLGSTITLTNVPINVSSTSLNISNFSILFPGQSDDASAVYRIDANYVIGTLTATLDAPFTGATSTAASFRLHQDRYALPADCGKVLQVRRYGDAFPIQRVGVEQMYQMKLTDQTQGRPQMFTVDDFETSGNPTTARMLVIHPYPDRPYRMEVLYKQQLNTELSGTTQPFMPDEWRHLLVYGALTIGYPQFLNDTERGGYNATLYESGLLRMSLVNRDYGDDPPQMQPNMTDYRPMNRRRRAGMTTLGSWFDRLPNVP